MNDDDPFWTFPRVMSGMIVIAYIVLYGVYYGPRGAVGIAGFCILPTACIWFPRVMGGYRGLGICFPRGIQRPSPPTMVFILGWVVLSLPVLQRLVALLLS